VTACIIGLKTAVPEEWHDFQHQHLEHTGKDSGPVKYELGAKARQHIEEVKELLFGERPSAEHPQANGTGPGNGRGVQ
jgi:hypothetical protein